jgi:hypothetical protein
VENPQTVQSPDSLDDKIARAEYIRKLALKLNDVSPITEKPLTPVTMTKRAADEDEVKFFIAYGPHGVGKSTYLAKCLAQLNHTWDPNILKRFLVWKPSMLVDIVDYVESTGHDELMLGCDDAGVWLNALKWNHPLLAALTEYFDVIRMHFHGIMFTSPLPLHVIKRIRGLPQAITVKIIKLNRNLNKPREGRGYTQYMLPDLKRTGVKPEFIDNFFAIMPEKFYSWYYPARKSYTREAWAQVKLELRKYSHIEPPML